MHLPICKSCYILAAQVVTVVRSTVRSALAVLPGATLRRRMHGYRSLWLGACRGSVRLRISMGARRPNAPSLAPWHLHTDPLRARMRQVPLSPCVPSAVPSGAGCTGVGRCGSRHAVAPCGCAYLWVRAVRTRHRSPHAAIVLTRCVFVCVRSALTVCAIGGTVRRWMHGHRSL